MSVNGVGGTRFLFFLACCSASAFAGQSIKLSDAFIINESVAAQLPNNTCRVEVSFHDWDDNPPPASHPWTAPACGFDLTLYNFGQGDIRIQLYSTQDKSPQVCMIRLGVDAYGNPVLPSKFATVRYQRVPTASGNNGVEYCEATDINGTTFSSQSNSYTGTNGTLAKAAYMGKTGSSVSTAYFRLFTTAVPLGSRPPVTADRGDLLDWKFDGNLT